MMSKAFTNVPFINEDIRFVGEVAVEPATPMPKPWMGAPTNVCKKAKSVVSCLPFNDRAEIGDVQRQLVKDVGQ